MNRLRRHANNKARPLKADPRKDFNELAADVMLSPHETASVLGLAHNTLRSWRYHNAGPPATKLGRSVRYAVGDLRKWLDQQRHAS